MKKIVAILMAMLMVMSVTVVLAGGAKDVNPEADAGLTEFTQDKASQDIESAYDGGQIRIKCEFAKPIIERVEYDRVRVKSLRNLGNPGEPVLPFKTLYILLPQGKTVQSIEVTGNQFHLPGKYRVEHGQEPVPVGSESKYRTPPDPAIYESTNPFPGKMFTKASIQELRGYKILILNLYPVQYVPKAGGISYFDSMDVIVNTAPETISDNFRGLPKDRARVLDVVDNPEVVETYETIPQSAVLPAGSYDYVIITNSDLSAEFQTLADWKTTEKGVNTEIVTVESISAEYNGVDLQDKIRNFIIDAYNNWDITYVLLGGDVEIIPHRNFYVQTSFWYRYYIPSDLYYAGLDGTWNNDGDSRYGEPGEEDLYAEVYVGRAPVDTVYDVSRFVTKTIAYENDPPADYLKNALMLGAKLDDYTDGGEVKDSICTYKIPDDWSVTKLYESDESASVSTTTRELNNGQHVVNNIGHANQQVIGLACVDYEEYYTRDHVDALTNDEFFLFYTIGCYANAFDYDDCIGEHFVNNDNGAFAFIGNTRYGWYASGYPKAYSAHFDIEFFDELFKNDTTNMGKTLQYSKENLAGTVADNPWMRYCYYTLNLLGDPETSLATVPIGPQAPSIIGYAPESPVSDIEEATRTFNITVDQTVNVSWQINGTEVQRNESTKEASYTNTSAVMGIWNVSAIASNPNGTAMQTWIWNVVPPDIAPPTSVTDLNESAVGETWINWTWTNPTDPEFSHVMVYLNGSFNENVTTNYYNATGLETGTEYEIGTHTVDTSENINQTWVNDTAKTLTSDTIPPAITNATGDTSSTTGEAKTISATITDDVDVVSATVHYTPIDGTETMVPMTGGAGDVWSADVPVASDKVGTITYYITAEDAASNTARDPATGTYSIAVTDNDAPSPISDLSATAVAGGDVELAWSVATDNIEVVSYNIDRELSKITDVTGLTPIANTSGTTYTDTTGVEGTTYYYAVTAVDAAGNEADASNSPSATPDATAPAISAVDSSDVTGTSATITWTTDEASDSVVNYGTTTPPESTESNPAMVTSHSVTLTGLAPDTTYYYEVQSTDAAGNTATDDNSTNYYTFTTTAPGDTMHIASINMSTTKIKLNGWYTYATATVTIVDADGPVEGATVYGNWSGLTSDTDSGTTVSGIVALESDSVKNAKGTFAFTVDDVVLSGWEYKPEENVETSDSITVP